MITINGVLVNPQFFPNGEYHLEPVYNLDESFPFEWLFNIRWRFENNDEMLLLELLVSDIRDSFYSSKDIAVELTLDYVPYCRMDRETENQMFTLKHFIKSINRLEFNKVYILDAHSNVSKMLNNCVYLKANEYINMIIPRYEKPDYLFYPDLGASKKYSEELSDIKIPYLTGTKHRDLETGYLTKNSILEDTDVTDKSILIVDDICVRGYTTLFGAKSLKEKGASRVTFYCSHCENAIFDGELLTTDYVDHIYTTSSLVLKQHHRKITVIA